MKLKVICKLLQYWLFEWRFFLVEFKRISGGDQSLTSINYLVDLIVTQYIFLLHKKIKNMNPIKHTISIDAILLVSLHSCYF